MGFWGIEVKPGKPYPYHSENVPGKLRVTQATLGLGSSKERSIVQCTIGHKNPIFLCSLLPKKIESCSLDLEFEDDELLAFSVIGPRSVHLSGYFVADEGDFERDDYGFDSFGEDIGGDSEESSEYDSEDQYEDYFDEDDDDDEEEEEDLDVFPPSPVPNRGVVIEEILDDETLENGNDLPKRLKMDRPSDSVDNGESGKQTVVKSDVGGKLSESEDEDGFPVSTTRKGKSTVSKPEKELVPDKKDWQTEIAKSKKAKEGDDASTLKRKVEGIDQADQPDRQKKKKKKKKKEEAKDANASETENDTGVENTKQHEELKSYGMKESLPIESGQGSTPSNESDADEKKKKKKKKKKEKSRGSEGAEVDQSVTTAGDENHSTALTEEKESKAKSSHVRTFPNGLVIEELSMGKPDGKRASPGKQVSVHYIGKLKSGKIFDSNVGRAPFKFRLGVGQVIKGWDVGVNGMRVGDKRRLTIPPSMGYGSKGAGAKIPPNSWLTFDVELVDVR